MPTRILPFSLILVALLALTCSGQEPKRVLLLAQSPDGHPKTTHEYLAGQRILKHLLAQFDELETEIVDADSPWEEGPEKLRQADVVVMFVSEGARWINEDQRRYQAFVETADRGAGLIALHWAVGTREAKNIRPFVNLFGGCHGGPDRKHAVFETSFDPASSRHPIAFGVDSTDVREEFYYRLKWVEPATDVVPVMTAAIDGQDETVAWAWQRPDGGKSFGFTGLHFHENWRHESYRRLVVQSVLWSCNQEIPEGGVDVSIDEEMLELK